DLRISGAWRSGESDRVWRGPRSVGADDAGRHFDGEPCGSGKINRRRRSAGCAVRKMCNAPMASQSEDGPHAVLSRKVIGAAMRVLNALRAGLDEKVYENALVVELEYAGEVVEQQRQFPVHYRGQLVGKLIPDLIVGESVIVDAKVVSGFSDAHI